MDIDGHPTHSSANIENAPISNFDCKSKIEMENIIQRWKSWARTQKMLHKDKVPWSDLALRITWGFVGNLNIWWERVSPRSKLRILEHEKPLDELINAVVHEFYGNIRINTSHYADLFMNQKLCHLSQLPKYYCTM
jgi:hypothetical protein